MTLPNINTLAALVLAQDAEFHTRSGSVLQQIFDNVWSRYYPFTQPVADVAGLGAAIYAAIIAAGFTAGIGGVAYILELISNIVLTYTP